MNLENIEEQCTASMLITRNGYLVKVHKPVENGLYRKICFFVDKDFNHRPWKKTIEDGMPLMDKEFYRLKKHPVTPLREVSLREKQFALAMAIVALVESDPYYGLEEDRKQFYEKEKALSYYADYYATYKKVAPKPEAVKQHQEIPVVAKVQTPARPAQKSKGNATRKKRKKHPAKPVTNMPVAKPAQQSPSPTMAIPRDSKEAIRKAKGECPKTLLGIKGGLEALAQLRSA